MATAGTKYAKMSGVLFDDRRDMYLTPQTVAELYKEVTPYISVLNRFGSKKTQDPDFELFEHRGSWLNMKFYVDSDTDTITKGSDLTISIDDGTGSDPGFFTANSNDVQGLLLDIYDSTLATHKAQVILKTVTGSQTIVTDPLYVDDSGTTALADNDVIFVVGHAAEEGGKAPEAWSDELETVYNSAGIFKTPLEVTGTLLAMTRLRGYSSELARLRSEKMKEHKIKQAKALYFSRRYDTTAVAASTQTGARSRPIRTMHGIIPIINDYSAAANVHSITMASYDWDSFVDDMESYFEYSNAKGTKWLFCGDAVISFFSKIGNSGFGSGNTFNFNIELSKPHTQLGINVQSLMTGMGTLRLANDKLFTRGFYDSVGSARPFSGWGVIVDPETMSKVTFRGDKYQTGLATADYGGELVKDQYFSDWGIGATLPEQNHLLKFV